jgi:hypothetical protein
VAKPPENGAASLMPYCWRGSASTSRPTGRLSAEEIAVGYEQLLPAA